MEKTGLLDGKLSTNTNKAILIESQLKQLMGKDMNERSKKCDLFNSNPIEVRKYFYRDMLGC